MKSPNWCEEELILAVSFYLEHGRKWINSCSSKSPDIIAFSNLLRSLMFFSEERKQISNFRSPASIHMKLMNFKGIDQENTAEGLRNSSVLDRQVWNTYANNPKILRVKAASIISEFSPSVAVNTSFSDGNLQNNYYQAKLSEARGTLEILSRQFRSLREKAVSIEPIAESQNIMNLMYEYISQLALWHETIDSLISADPQQHTEIDAPNNTIRFSQKYSSVENRFNKSNSPGNQGD